MLNFLSNLFSWLTGLWEKVPESAKEQIIGMIVVTFEEMFRAYFRSEKSKNGDNNA